MRPRKLVKRERGLDLDAAVLIRCKRESKLRWEALARAGGVTLSQWIRVGLDLLAAERQS